MIIAFIMRLCSSHESKVTGVRSIRVFVLCVLEGDLMNEELVGKAELQ